MYNYLTGHHITDSFSAANLQTCTFHHSSATDEGNHYLTANGDTVSKQAVFFFQKTEKNKAPFHVAGRARRDGPGRA